jgi:N-acetylglucosaminyldiphosphoundecaprenol N-acetyl-beta-D-mannosaminyltransferase
MHPGVDILGVLVSPVSMNEAVRSIAGWVEARTPTYVTVTPAHAVMEAYRDPEFRRIVNAGGLTTPDGMSIVWLLRLQGHRNVERVYGPDLMLELCREGIARGFRHYLFGAAEGVAAALANRLGDLLPGIHIAGTFSPPFGPVSDEEEDQATVTMINDARPDVVWVGLSTPKQERWMAAHLGRIEAPVMIGVGAAFDFLSGAKPQAPRWMQRTGLEWLFRLATEPRRLWPRYREYPLFVLLAVAQLLGFRRYAKT